MCYSKAPSTTPRHCSQQLRNKNVDEATATLERRRRLHSMKIQHQNLKINTEALSNSDDLDSNDSLHSRRSFHSMLSIPTPFKTNNKNKKERHENKNGHVEASSPVVLASSSSLPKRARSTRTGTTSVTERPGRRNISRSMPERLAQSQRVRRSESSPIQRTMVSKAA